MYKSFHDDTEEEKAGGKKLWNKMKFGLKMKKEEMGFVDKLKTYLMSNSVTKFACGCFLKGEGVKKKAEHMFKV